MAAKIKKGDEVVVISGSHKGKRGKILNFLPKKNRVIVEGVNMIKKHVKQNPQDPNAEDTGIIESEGSVHFSNIMLASRFDAKSAS
ncbi:MAG: 50S ribosomal protein L24 [Opitutales bacterium]|nr:50S ribosomal protein L24 [Opitutales bacterium]NRA26166.1 50S ribosomal protein L24 [Opitutales bacterium]